MPRILLVDDDPTFRRRAAALIEEGLPGVLVEQSSTARDGTARALFEPWSLILLDIHLPDGSGLHVLKVLQATRPEVPIIMVSSLSPIPYADAVLRLGARGFVPKSRVSDELISIVHRAMRSDP